MSDKPLMGRQGGPRNEGNKRFKAGKRKRDAAKLYEQINPSTGKPYTQKEIGAKLGVHQTLVSKGLRDTVQRYEQQAVAFIRQHRQRFIALAAERKQKSDERIAELYAAWQRSQQPGKITRLERSMGPARAGADGAKLEPEVLDSKAVQTTEEQVGDVRIMVAIREEFDGQRKEDRQVMELLGMFKEAEQQGPEVPITPGDTLVIRVLNNGAANEPEKGGSDGAK